MMSICRVNVCQFLFITLLYYYPCVSYLNAVLSSSFLFFLSSFFFLFLLSFCLFFFSFFFLLFIYFKQFNLVSLFSIPPPHPTLPSPSPHFSSTCPEHRLHMDLYRPLCVDYVNLTIKFRVLHQSAGCVVSLVHYSQRWKYCLWNILVKDRFITLADLFGTICLKHSATLIVCVYVCVCVCVLLCYYKAPCAPTLCGRWAL